MDGFIIYADEVISHRSYKIREAMMKINRLVLCHPQGRLNDVLCQIAIANFENSPRTRFAIGLQTNKPQEQTRTKKSGEIRD